MPKTSAGLLPYRRRDERLEVFLVHPGGPFWANKDMHSWSIAILLKPKPTRIDLIRSRDEALGFLIPAILGVLWERGGRDPDRILGDLPSVRLVSGVVVGGYPVGRGAFGLRVYRYEGTADLQRGYDGGPTKVFSVHLAERPVIAPGFDRFKYLNGRCCVLSWRRGEWENCIVAERTEPRTIAHVLVGGMSKNRR